MRGQPTSKLVTHTKIHKHKRACFTSISKYTHRTAWELNLTIHVMTSPSSILYAHTWTEMQNKNESNREISFNLKWNIRFCNWKSLVPPPSHKLGSHNYINILYQWLITKPHLPAPTLVCISCIAFITFRNENKCLRLRLKAPP